MNVRNRIIAVVVLSLAIGSCFAQGGGGGQGRGGRGGGGLVGLLNRKDVQTELALTPDQVTKLDELRQSMRGQRGGGGAPGGAGAPGAGGGGAPGAPRDPAAMAAAQAEREKPFLAILTDVQVKRVKELVIQQAGDMAALMPDVETALALTDDQKAKIKDLQAKQREANMAIGEKLRNQEIDRAAATEARQKNTAVLKEELHKLLTADQLAKLKDLGGKPFTWDPPLGG